MCLDFDTFPIINTELYDSGKTSFRIWEDL